jgi:hypothetical protein
MTIKDLRVEIDATNKAIDGLLAYQEAATEHYSAAAWSGSLRVVEDAGRMLRELREHRDSCQRAIDYRLSLGEDDPTESPAKRLQRLADSLRACTGATFVRVWDTAPGRNGYHAESGASSRGGRT